MHRIAPVLILFFFFNFFGCSNKIYPDRSQFIKDGQPLPGISLREYKSVQERPSQNADLALAIAISGGGSRAANFGMGILLGLQQIELSEGKSVLGEIDYLSTVSGGGFAGGAFIAALYEHHYYHRDIPFSLHDCMDNFIEIELQSNYASALIKSLFNPRIWFSYLDDGDALERTIDNKVMGYDRRKKLRKNYPLVKLPAKSILLGDLFISVDSSNRQVHFPMLFANSSLVDKMGIFPFTPDILSDYSITGYTHRMKKRKKGSAFNPFNMPVSVGIKASGSFPVLISNTTLISNYHYKRKYLHLFDGAMTDNFGYETAVAALNQDWVASKKRLFVIDADNTGNTYTFSKKEAARFSLKVMAQLASSGLDARRISLQSYLDALCESFGSVPLVFSFSALIKDNIELPPPEFHLPTEQNRLIKKMSEDLNSLSLVDLQILYEIVTHIGTKYTITEAEQQLLLLTGQKVVLLMKPNILEAIK